MPPASCCPRQAPWAKLSCLFPGCLRAPSSPPPAPSLPGHRLRHARTGGTRPGTRGAHLGPVPVGRDAADVPPAVERDRSGRRRHPAHRRGRRERGHQPARHHRAVGQGGTAARRPVAGHRQTHLPARHRALLHRRPGAVPGRRPALHRRQGRGRPEGRPHAPAGRALPVQPEPGQRHRRKPDHVGQDRHLAGRHLLHLPAGPAPVGVHGHPHRRGPGTGHGHRAQRHPAPGRRARAVAALCALPHRRPPPHRPAVAHAGSRRPQRLRVRTAHLPQPGPQLRRHPQAALAVQARPDAGR